RLKYLGLRVNRNLLTGAVVAFESDDARDQSIKSEVATETDVAARVELGADLTNQDLACANDFATVALHTAHLRIGITTVFRTTTGFFMCHLSFPDSFST